MNEQLNRRFNRIVKIFTKEDILQYLQEFFEENEIEAFVDMLENRFNEFVIDFNIQSSSAKIIPKDVFGQEKFDAMIAQKQFGEYYLQQNLDGFKTNGQQIVFDRVWVRTDKNPQEFLEWLENRL